MIAPEVWEFIFSDLTIVINVVQESEEPEADEARKALARILENLDFIYLKTLHQQTKGNHL